MTNKTMVRIGVWVRVWIKIYTRQRNYYHLGISLGGVKRAKDEKSKILGCVT